MPLADGGTIDYANFDGAATAAPLQAVAERVAEVLPYYASVNRGAGWHSQVSTTLYEEARRTIGSFVGARGDDVTVLTRNTTDALNLLASALPTGPDRSPGRVLVLDTEHHANLLPWHESPGGATVLSTPDTIAETLVALARRARAAAVRPRRRHRCLERHRGDAAAGRGRRARAPRRRARRRRRRPAAAAPPLLAQRRRRRLRRLLRAQALRAVRRGRTGRPRGLARRRAAVPRGRRRRTPCPRPDHRVGDRPRPARGRHAQPARCRRARCRRGRDRRRARGGRRRPRASAPRPAARRPGLVGPASSRCRSGRTRRTRWASCRSASPITTRPSWRRTSRRSTASASAPGCSARTRCCGGSGDRTARCARASTSAPPTSTSTACSTAWRRTCAGGLRRSYTVVGGSWVVSPDARPVPGITTAAALASTAGCGQPRRGPVTSAAS